MIKGCKLEIADRSMNILGVWRIENSPFRLPQHRACLDVAGGVPYEFTLNHVFRIYSDPRERTKYRRFRLFSFDQIVDHIKQRIHGISYERITFSI